MKFREIKISHVKAVIILILILGNIYYNTHYAKIDSRTFKTDVKEIHFVDLDNNKNIRQLNKCREIEELFITGTNEKSFSKLRNFHNLSDLIIGHCEISSSDCEKISQFDNLRELDTCSDTVIDFKGFNSDIVSCIRFLESKVINFKSLSECKSLKSITIGFATVCDNCIVVEDNKYVMKDSSVFASFDYVEELRIFVDKIEDISGIIEMDSLKVLEVDKGTLSEDDKRLLEDKGISVIENE
ncbi:MAG: hypothetical protein NC205_04330 [Prevotella sp.]|nr:hypothetical protein [Alistipes senegalensis]MCM1357799.1 hypothetical protein [Prevotella sp.]MCM1472507.1 hypothetical protein [Muribaculaceae bacterium]